MRSASVPFTIFGESGVRTSRRDCVSASLNFGLMCVLYPGTIRYALLQRTPCCPDLFAALTTEGRRLSSERPVWRKRDHSAMQTNRMGRSEEEETVGGNAFIVMRGGVNEGQNPWTKLLMLAGRSGNPEAPRHREVVGVEPAIRSLAMPVLLHRHALDFQPGQPQRSQTAGSPPGAAAGLPAAAACATSAGTVFGQRLRLPTDPRPGGGVWADSASAHARRGSAGPAHGTGVSAHCR